MVQMIYHACLKELCSCPKFIAIPSPVLKNKSKSRPRNNRLILLTLEDLGNKAIIML